ncbi:MAG: cobalamin biosynthesis protein CobD [Desulfamplus sp.]|nr:cobalamin biosynthesis protein CobD [Desulfamplus sp.]
MIDDSLCYIVLAAYVMDMMLGDPIWLPHPVIWMGNAISFFEAPFRNLIAKTGSNTPPLESKLFIKNDFYAGLLFALFLIFSTWVTAFAAVKLSCIIHPMAGIVVQVILMFFCLSARTLERAASDVKNAIENGGIDEGREKVSMIVGREVKYLNETGVVKATVETVAENFVDGFLSPLFFALVGGVPLAVAYKMVNTLDSMVGYQNEKYILFGRASARIDDAANFIPARISVIIISIAAAVLSLKRGKLAFKTAINEGMEHKSPNSGYPEAAFAGALQVKLGGPNYYHGTLVKKPYIGKSFPDPGREKIKMACDLMLLSSLIVVIIIFITGNTL